MRMRGVLLLIASMAAGTTVTGLAQTINLQKKPNISGVVRDGSDNPLSDAQLSFSREGQTPRLARTDAEGKYSFADLAPGQGEISVRRLGFRGTSKSVDVPPAGRETTLDFQLVEVPSDIADVIVEGSKGHLQEFYDHKATNKFAKFFERSDIEKRNPTYLSEMVTTVSGARMSSKGFGNSILLRGCQPMVWVDGQRAPGAELDDVARPSDVAGLEVYPSSAGLPPEYQDRNNRMCGAIMVWTKNQ